MKSYFRYVDILLYTYNFIQRLAKVMVISSNKNNKNIQFTLETYIDNNIKFFDLSVNRIFYNKTNLNIYRKIMYTVL